MRPASERTQTQTKSEPEGPKITKLKSKGPRKGEATASQVQGWRGSDRTNTNRRGQSAPQAKALAKEELELLSQYFVDEGIASNQTELDEIFENIDQEHYEYHLDKAMGLY